MAFLQPVMFWGALAIAIPVIIHFWYQKKGKTIAWAATQWLTDKTNMQHRGIRLDEVPLLIIRCLLILLLVALLARPVLNWTKNDQSNSVVHLIEPSQELISNFRFELEEGLKKGERIFILAEENKEVKSLSDIPKTPSNTLNLQNGVTHAAKFGSEIHIYIRNKSSLVQQPKIVVPVSFKLFSIIDSTKQGAVPYIAGKEGQRIFKDPGTGLLKVEKSKNQSGIGPVNTGDIQVLQDFENQDEQRTVKAALVALKETYFLPLVINSIYKPQEAYSLVLTDKAVMNPSPQTLYIISASSTDGLLSHNVIELPDSIRLSSSALVKNGQLPEWLGNKLVDFYGLNNQDVPLSKAQLNALFVQSEEKNGLYSDQVSKLLLLAFVMLFLLERWISLNKNVGQSYA